MRQADVHRQLSGRHRRERVRAAHCDWGLPWRGGEDPRSQRAARDYWTCVPAGRSVRREVPAIEEGEAAGDRLSRTIRGRLRAAHGDTHRAERRAHWKESCHRRKRAIWIDCGRRSDPEGAQGQRV